MWCVEEEKKTKACLNAEQYTICRVIKPRAAKSSPFSYSPPVCRKKNAETGFIFVFIRFYRLKLALILVYTQPPSLLPPSPPINQQTNNTFSFVNFLLCFNIYAFLCVYFGICTCVTNIVNYTLSFSGPICNFEEHGLCSGHLLFIPYPYFFITSLPKHGVWLRSTSKKLYNLTIIPLMFMIMMMIMVPLVMIQAVDLHYCAIFSANIFGSWFYYYFFLIFYFSFGSYQTFYNLVCNGNFVATIFVLSYMISSCIYLKSIILNFI